MSYKHFISLGMFVVGMAVVGFITRVSVVYAAMPTLSLTATTGDSVRVTVSGDPNSGVIFNYNVGSSDGAFVTSLGTTDGSGSYSKEISASGYAVNTTFKVSVTVNGQTSAPATWPGAGQSTGTSSTATTTTTTTGSLYLDQATLSIPISQIRTVTVFGGAGYFVSNNANPGVASAVLNGSVLTVTGLSVGSTAVTICSTANGCTLLSITVPTPGSTTTTQSAQSTTVIASGSLLAKIQALQAVVAQVLTQIQSIQTQLAQLVADAGSGTTVATNTGSTVSSNTSVAGASYTFTQLLKLGSQGAEVTALQNRLTALKLYSGPIDGKYSSLLEATVKLYQLSHGIDAVGYVGPGTRAALNAGQ